ncbi:uncharacterized protein J4E84_006731 [Alternaria hordeiaustralica]|uniref:uncharacterized protein n=1 Tax=Alternaria hordeiaustralica TaxID=1187925 RepID=UPI0020C38B34|nr:uncharacterized protein J4E84_006731 [Alternaria hordeiaustralica]KAI4683891.1 hypothetical protein J4E84_006731 [Alternaria hordeiaustralica]
MTNLLDLPVEIFQMITHELVKSAINNVKGLSRRFEIDSVWRLRDVCRTFAAEIERNVFSQQPKEIYFNVYSVQRLALKRLPRYMMQVKRIPGNINEDFHGRLQRMTNYILQELDIEDEKQRTGIIERFYLSLGKIVDASKLSHALWCDCGPSCHYVTQNQNSTELSVQDRLYTSLMVGAHDVLASVLTELSGMEKDALFDVEPFRIARDLGDTESIDVIVRYLETRSSSVQAALTSEDAMFPIHSTISIALATDSGTIAQTLLDYHKKNLRSPTRHAYNYWVSRAVHASTTKYLHNLTAVLDFHPEGRRRVLRETMLSICAGGSSEDVQEALKRVEDVDKGTALNAPIFIAVRSGRVAAVQGCIQAGVNVDLAVRSNIPTLHKDTITPLDVAMNRNDGYIAEVLIKAGATIPHISQWPGTGRVYKVLRKAVSERTNVKLPDLRNFQHMSLAERKDIQY